VDSVILLRSKLLVPQSPFEFVRVVLVGIIFEFVGSSGAGWVLGVLLAHALVLVLHKLRCNM